MRTSHCLACLFLLLTSWLTAVPRNVVLIVADDHGLDTGCYGNPVIRTPALDRLASEGVRFVNAYATTASCSASRSVILTGLYNHRTGQYGHEHSYHHFRSFETLESLPVLLKKAGYRTARVGKFHVAPEEVYRFDTVLTADSRNAVEMAEASAPFVSASSLQPFFLYFCPDDPHRSGRRDENSPYRPDRFGNRAEGYTGVRAETYQPSTVVVPPFLPDTPSARAELAEYYQSVSRVDQGVARLVRILENAGVYDETLIIYISDNGIAFPGAKTTVYEPGLKLPCIVRNPYLGRKDLVNQAFINWADLTPTILEFAKYQSEPGTFHGRSFLAILGEERPTGWDETFASHTFHEVTMYYPMRVVRAGRYKLIWNLAHPLPFPFASDLWAASTWQDVYQQGPKAIFGRRSVDAYIHRPEFELYDLANDPDEERNLAGHPDFASLLASLKSKLREFQERTGDPWIQKWDYE